MKIPNERRLPQNAYDSKDFKKSTNDKDREKESHSV